MYEGNLYDHMTDSSYKAVTIKECDKTLKICNKVIDKLVNLAVFKGGCDKQPLMILSLAQIIGDRSLSECIGGD